MKLLIVSQYFWPENFRINDLVAGLVERGHDVTVLTGQPNYPSGILHKGYGGLRIRRETYAGAHVIRVPMLVRGSGSGLRLALNYLSFAISATIGAYVCLREKFDAIFVFEVSPVTVGIPAIAAGKRTGAPIVFWVLDLWPQSLTAAGGVRAPWLLAGVEKLVRFIYRRCARILVQSRAFIPEITRQGVPASAIRYFPNWGEQALQPVSAPDLSLLPPLPAGFRILYTGNIGEAQDFPSIIAAAELLRYRNDIQWLIAGGGRMESWARAEVQKRGLQNVHFLGQHPLEIMPHFYAAADALLLPLKREPIFALTIPGKLQSYLACGRPVLAMLDGEGSAIVREAQAGLACPAGDAAALAANAAELAALPPQNRAHMGASGRRYYEANFDRVLLFNLLETWLNDVTQEPKP